MLLENCAFKPVAESEIANRRIFESRSVDEIKPVSDRLKRRRILFVLKYSHTDAETVLNKTPTAQSFSQRLKLCLKTSLTPMQCYTQDVTQEYIQLRTPLDRDKFI